MQTLLQDVRFGLRMLARNPGFTAVAIITLALGIGGTTAIFSVINGILLKPLPYPHPDELIAVWLTAPGLDIKHLNPSPADYLIYREQNRTFQDIGLYMGDSGNVTGLAEPEHVRALDVTDGVLPILGVPPMLGRWFTPADDLPQMPFVRLGNHNREGAGFQSALSRQTVQSGTSATGHREGGYTFRARYLLSLRRVDMHFVAA